MKKITKIAMSILGMLIVAAVAVATNLLSTESAYTLAFTAPGIASIEGIVFERAHSFAMWLIAENKTVDANGRRKRNEFSDEWLNEYDQGKFVIEGYEYY